MRLTEPDKHGVVPPRSRIARARSGTRELVRIVYRDPEHVSERLTLYAIGRLGPSSQEWARSALEAHPETSPAVLAEQVRLQTAGIARIDGAISGTPFFLALVPGYLTYLLQEMRMTLRTATLYGRDAQQLQTASEMLALRGVHPDVDTALAALTKVQKAPMPSAPTERRALRTWIRSVYLLLVFGGFMSPATAKEQVTGARARVRAWISLLLGGALWLMTWVLPLTFMIVMAWGCEIHARQLGRRAIVFYGGDAASVSAAVAVADERRDRGHDKRTILRALALLVSVGIPIAFVTYVNHVRNTVGLNWLGALGALVALSLVLATAAISTRR